MNTIRDRDIAADCACLKLRSAARAVTRAYDKALQPLDLKATQFTLLTAVGLLSPVSITVLADKLSMDRTTLTRNLRPLQKRDLLSGSAGRGRTVELELTVTGRALVEAGKPLWSRAQARFAQALPAEMWTQLKGGLDRIAQYE